MKVKAKKDFVCPFLGEVMKGKSYELKDVVANYYIQDGSFEEVKSKSREREYE